MTQRTEIKPRQRFHDEDVARLKAALDTGQQKYEPKIRSKSMGDLMNAMRKDIVTLRERGYTITTIASMIHEGGFDHLAPATLRKYVSAASARKRRPKRSAKTRPVSASTPPPLAPSIPAQSPDTPARSAEFTVNPDHEDL